MLISNNKVTMYESLKNSINLSEEIIINVSFIRDSGLKLLIPELKKARSEGKSIKILTSDYMNVTEPNALYRLLDIPGVKIFKNPEKPSFHPKTYIFKNKNNVEIYVGSSNISYSALISGVEWSYQFFGDPQNSDINNILTEFDELYEKNSFELTLDWLRKYEKNYKKKEFQNYIDPDSPKNSIEEIEPIKFQVPALYELSKTREEGFNKALVIVATGLGKTYLSAFDSKNFDKILFVAHRDEILKDAQKTFETIYSDSKSYGFFNGSAKDTKKDIIFASVQTLSKNDYLSEDYFSKDYFDYIVVDEFHHSSAKSYSEILNYFKPKFLLGLTATPDRADSGDIYKLCDYNIAYECDLRVAINNGWLTPFQYFGIYDDTDYSLIPWR
ncbi:MAG: DEAD/DEAH box helicase family protein, partial [Cetobacterium sp.]